MANLFGRACAGSGVLKPSACLAEPPRGVAGSAGGLLVPSMLRVAGKRGFTTFTTFTNFLACALWGTVPKQWAIFGGLALHFPGISGNSALCVKSAATEIAIEECGVSAFHRDMDVPTPLPVRYTHPVADVSRRAPLCKNTPYIYTVYSYKEEGCLDTPAHPGMGRGEFAGLFGNLRALTSATGPYLFGQLYAWGRTFEIAGATRNLGFWAVGPLHTGVFQSKVACVLCSVAINCTDGDD